MILTTLSTNIKLLTNNLIIWATWLSTTAWINSSYMYNVIKYFSDVALIFMPIFQVIGYILASVVSTLTILKLGKDFFAAKKTRNVSKNKKG